MWGFEKSVKRTSGLKRNEIIDWQNLHNEELHNLHSSSNIITMIKPRRTRWAGHVAHMRKEESIQGFGGKERDH
jgi:hypothetical protein